MTLEVGYLTLGLFFGYLAGAGMGFFLSASWQLSKSRTRELGLMERLVPHTDKRIPSYQEMDTTVGVPKVRSNPSIPIGPPVIMPPSVTAVLEPSGPHSTSLRGTGSNGRNP